MFKIEIVVADSVYEACDVKYIRSHIFECIVAENCQRVCSLCKKRGEYTPRITYSVSVAALIETTFACESRSLLSGVVEYSIRLGCDHSK